MEFRERLGKGKVDIKKKKKPKFQEKQTPKKPLSVYRVQPSLDGVRLPCERCQVRPRTPFL